MRIPAEFIRFAHNISILNMRFERLTSTENPLFGRGMELYGISFPDHEQREQDSQRIIMSHPDYQFNLIFDGNLFVGLMLCWETENFIYVEHFCIFPSLRNNSYGGRSLDLLSERGKTVILEIDPPIDDISIRRKGFYVRSGFVANPYRHAHPPYHKRYSPHNLVVMSKPVELTQNEYEWFNNYLTETVMSSKYPQI